MDEFLLHQASENDEEQEGGGEGRSRKGRRRKRRRRKERELGLETKPGCLDNRGQRASSVIGRSRKKGEFLFFSNKQKGSSFREAPVEAAAAAWRWKRRC